MKRARIALFFCLACSCLTFAFDWPLDEPALAASFGTVSGSSFHPGIDVRSASSQVQAVAQGEVIFVEDGKGSSPLPSSLGSYLALYHDRGLISVYAKMRKGSVVDYLKRAKKCDILALAEPFSGANPASRMEFILFDSDKRQFVNPLLFLRPLPDKLSPVIRAVYLKRDATAVNILENRSFRQGLFELQADFGDPGLDAGARTLNAPFAVRVLLNGSEKINLKWDIGAEREGELRFFSDSGMGVSTFSLGSGAFRLGSFPIPRGRMNLQLIVSDFSQNEKSMSYNFLVD